MKKSSFILLLFCSCISKSITVSPLYSYTVSSVNADRKGYVFKIGGKRKFHTKVDTLKVGDTIQIGWISKR